MKLGKIKEKQVTESLGLGVLMYCLLNKNCVLCLWIFVTFGC